MPGLTRELIALRVARELQPGSVVNLGIGLPTLVAGFVDPADGILFQAENGILGYAGVTSRRLRSRPDQRRRPAGRPRPRGQLF